MLYVIASPIGNLGDITIRALEVLRQVDLIAAEDTRHTSVLLHRYEIRKPLTSLHEHNEARRTAELVERLRAGADWGAIAAEYLHGGAPATPLGRAEVAFFERHARKADGVPIGTGPDAHD